MSELSDRIDKLSPEKRALLEKRMRAQASPVRPTTEPIAVIGIGCRLPGDANSPQAFWDMLVAGRDAIREVPPERWSADEFYDPDSTVRGKMATRWGGFLNGIEDFDPAFFDITFREALHMDPQQRLLIETAWEAVEDAGLIAAELSGSSTGVFISAHNLSSDYYVRQWAKYSDIDAYSATGGAHSIIANRLSYWLDLHGPSMVVDTACSASLVATHLAINSIASGECDLAIAGGVNLIPSPDTTIALSGLQMMAADGRCKTFDVRADGFVRGEGCGAIILKRLSAAQRDGDEIYALIRGSAVNQDGRTNGLTAPNALSQQKVLQQALKRAGVSASQVGYIEAHGTGTALGDPIEIEALAEVIGSPVDGVPCVVGAVKTNIGHLESASGIAGLIKAILTLHKEYIPPNLHFTGLNPHISLDDTRLILATGGKSWPATGEQRFAGVSSFGFGGTNAHIVLEEAPRNTVRPSSEELPLDDALLLLSARNQATLLALATTYSELLMSDKLAFRDICFSAACRRTHHEHRLAVLASDSAAAANALRAFVAGEAPSSVIVRSAPGLDSPRTAWVFSGQGSQHVGMGRVLFETEPIFRQTVERIDELYSRLADWSLVHVIQTADEERLAQTEVAQPAIFAVEVALAELLKHHGLRPDMVVGHSLGEVAAAHVGGALSLEDAVTVIFHRGRMMQRMHGLGRMAAVSASAEDVRKVVASAYPGVCIAAINGPLSTTVSGEPAAVDAFASGVKWPCQTLTVQYAFHSLQMDSIQKEFVTTISHIAPDNSRVATYSTVHGGLARSGDFGPQYWGRNIRETVCFAAAIDSMANDNADCFVEIGPQAVLGPAVEQCLEAGQHAASVFGALLKNRPERLHEILADMYVNGARIHWPQHFKKSGRTVRLPTYPWQRQRCWFDPEKEVDERTDGQTDTDSWCYDVAWPLRTPLSGWVKRASIANPPSLSGVAAEVASRRDRIYRKHSAEDSVSLVDALEDRAALYAVAALRALGFSLLPGDKYKSTDLDAIAEGYRVHIVTRLFRLLEERGATRFDGTAWSVCDIELLGSASSQGIRGSGEGSEFFELLERCGGNVADVVRQRCDPLSLLFPGDYSTSAEWVYADAPISRVANDLLAEAVEELANKLPESRTLRVLEIGAGTGGSTRTILPRLRSDRTEYVFTDLSKSFLKQAADRFAADIPIHYELLDIEADPVTQGFAKQQFDLVIAANVLHATVDLRRSLKNVRDLLVPGGTLMLLEGTAQRGWIDLTFGLTEGWWRFADTDVRKDYPLLDVDRWQDLLRQCGFSDPAAIQVERDTRGCLFAQAILLARAPHAQAESLVVSSERPLENAAPWIVIGGSGDDGVTAALADGLRANGSPCVHVEYTEGESSFEDNAYRINPARRDDFVQMLQTLAATHDHGLHAIVHLAAVDESHQPGTTKEWDACMVRTCGSVLHLLQALEANSIQPKHGVWVVTRGAQSLRDNGRMNSVTQAAVWGLGRVAAREKPELWGGLVDLDFDADPEHDAALLERVVVSERSENQILLRGSDRFVARFISSSTPVSSAPDFKGDHSYLIVGGMGSVGLQVARWMVDQGVRHLTLTGRQGLPARSGSPAVEVVRELEEAGAEVNVMAADSSDSAQMAKVFATFDGDSPTLAGVIHAAAVIEFESLEDIDLDRFLDVVRAKVAGSWILHEQTAKLELDFMVFFSSMAAIGGFPQLGHYAAGNSFMDALAHHRRALGLPALSINWGLWSDARSTSDENRQLFERIGLRQMSSERALRVLRHVLAGNSTQKTIASVDWDTFRSVYESRGARNFLSRLAERPESSSSKSTMSTQPIQSALRNRLNTADPADVLRILQETICDVTATILGVSVTEVAGRTDGFFQMGMDSIMTVELRRRLETLLQTNLMTTLAFEYPTVERLTNYLASEILELEPQHPEQLLSVSEAIPVDSASDDLESFSDAELAAELDREMAELASADGRRRR